MPLQMTGVCTVCGGRWRWRATCWRWPVTAAACAPGSLWCCWASARPSSTCGMAASLRHTLERWHAPLLTKSKSSEWKNLMFFPQILASTCQSDMRGGYEFGGTIQFESSPEASYDYLAKCIGTQLLYCNHRQSVWHLSLPPAVLWRQASTAAARWPSGNVMREQSPQDSGNLSAGGTGKHMTACCKVGEPNGTKADMIFQCQRFV